MAYGKDIVNPDNNNYMLEVFPALEKATGNMNLKINKGKTKYLFRGYKENSVLW